MNNGADNNTNFGKQDGVDLKDLFTSMVENIHILINANDKNYNQRFDNVVEATKAALAASDRAVTKAEMASEKRFDAVNEFRSTLADQQRNLMPRAEVEIINKSVNEKIDKNDQRLTILEGKRQGISEGMGYIIGIIGVVSAIIAIVSRFIP